MLTDENIIEEYLDTKPMVAAEFLIDAIAKHQRAIETAKSLAEEILEARKPLEHTCRPHLTSAYFSSIMT